MSKSVWFGGIESREFPRFNGKGEVDVVIVGGGITGLAAADLIARSGRSVIVVDMRQPGEGETGHTTAHLTVAFDRGYQTVAKKIGEQAAELIAIASASSIDWLEARSRALGSGRFERVDGWIYSEAEKDVKWLVEEATASVNAGLDCRWEDHAPLPFTTKGAIRYPRQARFHPLEFCYALIDDLQKRGVTFHGDSKVVEVEDGSPCRVKIEGGGEITARDVVVATNVPVIDRVVMQTRLYAYRTYAIAVAATGDDPDALFFDTMEPYHYIRIQDTPDGKFLIVGGEDHRTGTETETERHIENLEAYTTERFGKRETKYHWSGQIIETPDGLPYAGLNPGAEHVYVATGYEGQGFTMGVASAGTIANLILREENALAELLSPGRIEIAAGAWKYLKENLEFPLHFLPDRLTRSDVNAPSTDEVPRGEGRIVAIDGEKCAAFRDEAGQVHLLSPVCPHLGCDVRWNGEESSWDCPCHGSRFDPKGKVLNGPARRDLSRK